MSIFRQFIYKCLLALRASPLRRLIISFLVYLHNFSYHMISLFASHTGTHPKHAIQQYHQFFVKNIAAGDRVLDIGCGHGDVSFDVAQKAQAVTGIDISRKNIDIARKKYQRENLEFIIGNAISFDWKEKFDVIILSNVLEHIEHRPEFLRRLAIIAPKILIRVPMITRDWISVYKKNEGFPYRLDDTHFIEYDEQTFAEEMRQAELLIDHQHVAFGELYAVVKNPTNPSPDRRW